jgi:hypothetical protein
MNTKKDEEQLKHEAIKREIDFVSEQVKQIDLIFAKTFPSRLSIRPIKKDDESNLTDGLNIPITILKPPPNRAGDYIDTLEQWGNLPKVLPLPDAAQYFAYKCKQNPEAILKMLIDAVLAQTINFWGLRASGEWEQGFIRIFKPIQGKPTIKLGANPTLKMQIENQGQLHAEVMGVNPTDVLAMLVSRGRKVPDELKHLLDKPIAPPSDKMSTSETEQVKPNNSKHWHDIARGIADEIDKRDEAQGARDSLKGIGERVLVELIKRGIDGPRTGATVKRDALQSKKWVRPRNRKLAEETGEMEEADKPI